MDAATQNGPRRVRHQGLENRLVLPGRHAQVRELDGPLLTRHLQELVEVIPGLLAMWALASLLWGHACIDQNNVTKSIRKKIKNHPKLH